MNKRFSASHHLPRYTKVLLDALFSPAIIFFVIMGNLFLFSCIAGLYYFEKVHNPDINNFFDVIWWGVTTVTTVGYGDIVPITTGGRIISMILMISGVSFFVGFSAILFSTFMDIENKHVLDEESRKEDALRREMIKRLDQISEKIARLETHLASKE